MESSELATHSGFTDNRNNTATDQTSLMPTIKTSLGHAKVIAEFVLKYLREPRFRHFCRTIPFTLRGFANSQAEELTANSSVATSLQSENASGSSNNPLRSYFDAHTEGRGIWKVLHYFDIYHRHFSKFVGGEVRILEVGIYSGGSLQMWRDYFGPKCHVYGIDIEQTCKIYENDFTDVVVGDQADRGFWRRFKQSVPPVDILIDDGGHLPEQQIVTLEEMLSHIRPGGVYLCEDVQGILHKFSAYVHGLAHSLNAWEASGPSEGKANRFQTAIQSIHFYPFVVVIERADTPVQGFFSRKNGTEWQSFSPRAKSSSPLSREAPPSPAGCGATRASLVNSK